VPFAIVVVMAEGKDTPTSEQEKEVRQSKPWTLKEFWGKPVWDWLQLLGVLAIPVVLAVGGCMVNAQQDARQQRMENQRAEAEQKLAEQRAQDEALQAYLGQMSHLMLEKGLPASEEGDTVFTLAQARTTTVLRQLDGEHNQAVTRFLYAAELLTKPTLLAEADLQNAELPKAMLQDANLAGTLLNGTNLADAMLINADFFAEGKMGETSPRTADLTEADLTDAALQYANLALCTLDKATLTNAALQNADLNSASLQDANLRDAALQSADLSPATPQGVPPGLLPKIPTNLTDANLRDADLTDADLTNAGLRDTTLSGALLGGADLSGADLTNATVTQEQLDKAESLEGATMPNGQILKSDDNPDGPTFEEWLKSKGSGEVGEGSGPS